MTKTELINRYNTKHAQCCKCGKDLYGRGISLGYFFVLDYEGNFYCTDCDQQFLDGDERIFDIEMAEDEEI